MPANEDDGVFPLDAEALALFEAKGVLPGRVVPQSGRANAAKVRRILQLTRDLAGGSLEGLRILDVGCGEGVYAIEAAIHGADVLAVDGRTERMEAGAACALRHGLHGVRFQQGDARTLHAHLVGTFDVVYLLGILYHFDAPDVFEVLRGMRALCRRFVLIDTLVATAAEDVVEWEGQRYAGTHVREHEDDDAAEVRQARVLRSLDNARSFHLTLPALVRALEHTGWTSVLQCHAPAEPGKAADRVTLVATVGRPVRLATYPWSNAPHETGGA